MRVSIESGFDRACRSIMDGPAKRAGFARGAAAFDPSSNRGSPERPRLPITINWAPISSATSRIRVTGSPITMR